MSAQGPVSCLKATTVGASLACRGVSFSYSEGGASVPALRDVSFSVPAGGAMALVGASGSGKSTLLQVIRGLDEPEGGAVVLDGVEPGAAGYAERQREVGLVFQTPEVQLFAATARDDVAFGPRRLGWAEPDVADAVAKALELVGLPEAVYADRHPYSLSGGEARRLALAGVLAMRPRLVLLDEPFVSLDPGSRRDLVGILERLRDEGITLLLVTHDVDLAWRLCERAARPRGRTRGRHWSLGLRGRRRTAAGGQPAARALSGRVVASTRERAGPGSADAGRGGGGAGMRATIAQYYPGTSPFHRLDPRAKFVAVTAMAVALFVLDSFIGLAVFAIAAALAYALESRARRLVLAGLSPAALARRSDVPGAAPLRSRGRFLQSGLSCISPGVASNWRRT